MLIIIPLPIPLPPFGEDLPVDPAPIEDASSEVPGGGSVEGNPPGASSEEAHASTPAEQDVAEEQWI